MKLLLDTHIWIWSLLEPSKLTPRIAKALENPANEKWLSPISVWEVRVLVEKGRVKLNTGFEEWISKALAQFPAREAPLTTEVILPSARFIFRTEIPPTPFLPLPQKSSNLLWLPPTPDCVLQKEFRFSSRVATTRSQRFGWLLRGLRSREQGRSRRPMRSETQGIEFRPLR